MKLNEAPLSEGHQAYVSAIQISATQHIARFSTEHQEWRSLCGIAITGDGSSTINMTRACNRCVTIYLQEWHMSTNHHLKRIVAMLDALQKRLDDLHTHNYVTKYGHRELTAEIEHIRDHLSE